MHVVHGTQGSKKLKILYSILGYCRPKKFMKKNIKNTYLFLIVDKFRNILLGITLTFSVFRS